ncbi:MAG TPA: hypothetical protein VHW69_04495 [Rhizomicrobium sp.]|jgi:predicted  nucleic acid-binding Zn-ribbon protein|nr:hypothetical protein [Rhizomicrobium sp.]
MSDANFADFITRERERLNGERQNIQTQQRALQQQLATIDQEMAAITAYETAKSGKGVRAVNGSSQRQARRGSKREELLKVITEGEGLSRGEILERMNLKGDKAGEMSISNALTALTKGN